MLYYIADGLWKGFLSLHVVSYPQQVEIILALSSYTDLHHLKSAPSQVSRVMLIYTS